MTSALSLLIYLFSQYFTFNTACKWVTRISGVTTHGALGHIPLQAAIFIFHRLSHLKASW